MQTLSTRFQDIWRSYQSRTERLFNGESLGKKDALSRQYLIGAFGAMILLLLLILSGVVWKYQSIAAQLKAMNDPQETAKKQALEVAAKVGKLIILPEEVPTLATVTDVAALPKQEFFAKAANDDQVLLYPLAKKVYLYRPSTNQLIDVATLTLQTTQAITDSAIALQTQTGGDSDSSLAPAPTPELVTLALYNGTTVTGLTTKFEAQLKEKTVSTPVTVKTNASASNYQKSLIIDVTGTNSQLVSTLATQLGLEKSNLPEGEQKPTADVLIILGSDVAAVQ